MKKVVYPREALMVFLQHFFFKFQKTIQMILNNVMVKGKLLKSADRGLIMLGVYGLVTLLFR